jgi:hypothetical protein
MTNKERVTVHRRRKRLGERAVTVIVSDQEIDFLLAQDYELSRKNGPRSVGRCRSSSQIRRCSPEPERSVSEA